MTRPKRVARRKAALTVLGRALSNRQLVAKLAGLLVALSASAFGLHLSAALVMSVLLAVGLGIETYERSAK